MSENTLRIIHRLYKDLTQREPIAFCPAVSLLNKASEQALLNKPTGFNPDEVCQILVIDSDKVVGGVNTFTTRVKVDEDIRVIQSGSHLFVNEKYRKSEIGADLFMDFTFLHSSQSCLTGGISQMAIKMYKALKYAVFEFPRLIYLRKSRSVIHSFFKTNSIFLTPVIWFADALLVIHRTLLSIPVYRILKDYEIHEEFTIPEEIESIVLSDAPQFMELHDKRWFEWALKYSFSDDKRNQKHLYSIRRDGKVQAFFLIKLEFFEQASSRGFKNVYLGSIMEWGIHPGSSLKESDIYLLAMRMFPKSCDGIQVASTNNDTIKKLKKYLFVNIGKANMAVRLGHKVLKEYDDMTQWRIRLAAGDTIVN